MACCICWDANQRVFFTKEQRRLVICRQCRHIYWDRMPDIAELAAYYERRYTASHHQAELQEGARDYYKAHAAELAAWTQRAPSDLRLVDYGCSLPVFCEQAAVSGVKEAIGVDYADEVRQDGRRRGIRVLHPCEIDALDDRSVDILRFSHTLEHTVDPVQVIAELLPKLADQALVYITQPSFPVFRYGPSELDLKDSVYPGHLQFFSPISLTVLAERLSLHVLQVFAHQAEEDVMAKYGPILDLDYARERMSPYCDLGHPYLHQFANYPYYAGENSGLYARFTAARGLQATVDGGATSAERDSLAGNRIGVAAGDLS
jgi:hypothetical protein